MVLPGQLDEVAPVTQEFEAQRAIERDRPLDVANDDLGNELLGGIDVWAFRSDHLEHGISPSTERRSQYEAELRLSSEPMRPPGTATQARSGW